MSDCTDPIFIVVSSWTHSFHDKQWTIFFGQSVNWTYALSKTRRFLWTCSLWRDNRCSTLLPKILGDGPFNVARFSLLKPLTDIRIYCAPRQDESSKPGVPKLLHVMACQTAALESCWEPLSQTNNDTKSFFFFFQFSAPYPPFNLPSSLMQPPDRVWRG